MLDSGPAFVVCGSNMSSNATAHDTSSRRTRAAVLVAEDELTDNEIAAAVGINTRTLQRWKHQSAFAAQVGGHIGAIQAGMLRLTIAKKHKRLAVLDQLHTKSLAVIEARAQRYQATMSDDAAVVAAQAARSVFGRETPFEAVTGLLVEKETVNNAGYRTVEWAVDRGLIQEIRSLHEQAAKELGQWVDRSEVSQTAVVQVIGVNVEAI